MYKIVADTVKSGHAEELIKIIKQYEIDGYKRKENNRNDRI